MFALPNWLICDVSPCASTAARNCAAFSIEGRRVTDEDDALPLYSTCAPPRPDFVVINTTPLAAFAP